MAKTDNRPEGPQSLSGWSRWIAAIIGVALITIGLVIHFRPPVRKIEETAFGVPSRTTRTEGDHPGIVTTLVIAGALLTGYGVNGLRVTGLSSNFGGLQMESPKAEPANAQQKIPASGGPDTSEEKVGENQTTTASAKPEKTDGSTNKPEQADGTTSDALPTKIDPLDMLRLFLQESSWNGLKVLRACKIAHKEKRTFNLRALCRSEYRMTYDYAYGYLIASSCAQIFRHNANQTGTVFTITHMHPVVQREIEYAISGRIEHVEKSSIAGAAESVAMRSELHKISDFFRSDDPIVGGPEA